MIICAHYWNYWVPIRFWGYEPPLQLRQLIRAFIYSWKLRAELAGRPTTIYQISPMYTALYHLYYILIILLSLIWAELSQVCRCFCIIRHWYAHKIHMLSHSRQLYLISYFIDFIAIVLADWGRTLSYLSGLVAETRALMSHFIIDTSFLYLFSSFIEFIFIIFVPYISRRLYEPLFHALSTHISIWLFTSLYATHAIWAWAYKLYRHNILRMTTNTIFDFTISIYITTACISPAAFICIICNYISLLPCL
jgi:hypothetical protein